MRQVAQMLMSPRQSLPLPITCILIGMPLLKRFVTFFQTPHLPARHSAFDSLATPLRRTQSNRLRWRFSGTHGNRVGQPNG